MDKEHELPAPGDRYFEIEVAKQHGGWSAWEKLSDQRRGELMAHELHKNMRDHYYHDVRNPDKKKKKVRMPSDLMREKFFEPPKPK